MFSHVMVGSNNIDAAKKFYDAVFTAAGGSEGVIDPRGRIIYTKDGARFLVTKPINGKDATHANGGTIGMVMTSTEMVDAWHAAGLANGGTSAENPPGIREAGGKRNYVGYLRDPDGNKLCGRFAMPD